ncbi:MAG: tRNA (guanosine(46)-N7)-methyltransferase TrmB [Cellvibrionaceae bacterium]|nr:tRNA (guanosine(46)-N7)-methyltransferase TrmB [Cellvibrionaceae bacterium]MCV6626755.1 tRNA (guanosine(46)-N7)-methyltransferase TrmB [Cellvibrionaceae bacterium]
MKPEYKPKSIRSFVIRAGRITEGQRRAFEQYWPSYGLSLFDGMQNFDEIFGRRAPRVLEVGFGMGDSLLEMAKAEPDKDFIGIEVHPPGVGRLINNAGLEGVNNLRVYMADANDVLEDCIADDSIDRFQLYFPDPWHKKKHNKRRIVNSAFVHALSRKLRPAGICHFATDWEPYAEHMMEVLSLAPELSNSQGEYLFAPRPDYRPVTKFERRGDRLGHGVWDLLFVKPENS